MDVVRFTVERAIVVVTISVASLGGKQFIYFNF
jgi:hypothetical protein